MAYFYCWLSFVIVHSFYSGYQNYKEIRKTGYNEAYFEQTGQKIEFNGGIGETVSCTLVSALRQQYAPALLISTTIYFLPLPARLFYISQ
jgi:hypothetical protein